MNAYLVSQFVQCLNLTHIGINFGLLGSIFSYLKWLKELGGTRNSHSIPIRKKVLCKTAIFHTTSKKLSFYSSYLYYSLHPLCQHFE